MFPVRPVFRSRHAFTLIELLVVIVIIAVLVAIALPMYSTITVKARQTATLNNMRQVGVAYMLYAADNDNKLPARVSERGADRWPKVMQPYLQDVSVYSSPVPTYAGSKYQTKDPVKLVSNEQNSTTLIANGYSDLGAFTDSSVCPRLNMLSEPSKVILLGIPYPGANNYYMDFIEGAGNNNDVVDKTPWPTGSIYVFSDGSSRFLKYRKTDNMLVAPTSSEYYSDWLWLMNKDMTNVIQQQQPANAG